jgi:hypothetical protein
MQWICPYASACKAWKLFAMLFGPLGTRLAVQALHDAVLRPVATGVITTATSSTTGATSNAHFLKAEGSSAC